MALSRIPADLIPEDQRMMVAIIREDKPAFAYAKSNDGRFVIAIDGKVTSCQN